MQDGKGKQAHRRAGQGRPPLRSSIVEWSVGVGLPDDPNRFSTAPPARHTGPALRGGVTRGAAKRADVGIGPYESGTRGATGRRPQGSPLRTIRTLCTPCKKLCHCEPVTDVTGVAIRFPVPMAPFRQGRLLCRAGQSPAPTHLFPHPLKKRGGRVATSY